MQNAFVDAPKRLANRTPIRGALSSFGPEFTETIAQVIRFVCSGVFLDKIRSEQEVVAVKPGAFNESR